MKHNTKTAGNASAIKNLVALANEFGLLSADTQDVYTAAEIAFDAVQRVLSGIKASDYVKAEWADDFYHVGTTERRHLEYQAMDAMYRAREADERATVLSDRLMDVVREMRSGAPVTAGATVPTDREQLETASEALEDVIAEWHAAYDAWMATMVDGELPGDTSEAAAEEEALLALASYPCVTLAEVRRKADLFLNRSYLRDGADGFTLDLLRSFAG